MVRKIADLTLKVKQSAAYLRLKNHKNGHDYRPLIFTA